MTNKFIAFLALFILFVLSPQFIHTATGQAAESNTKTVTLRIEGMT